MNVTWNASNGVVCLSYVVACSFVVTVCACGMPFVGLVSRESCES